MGLSAREQHALDSIEGGLAGSEPGLASLLGMFTQLTAGEALPVGEMIPPGREQTVFRPRLGRRCQPRGRTCGGIPRPRGRLSWHLAAALLGIGILIALVAVALTAGRGGGKGGCGNWGPVCAGSHLATSSATAR